MYYVRNVRWVKQNVPTVERTYWSDLELLKVLFKELALWKMFDRYYIF